MIKGYCHTNLDEYRCATFPTMFVELPRIGDFVEGRMGKFRPTLKVTRVTHTMSDGYLDFDPEFPQPIILVELHKAF